MRNQDPFHPRKQWLVALAQPARLADPVIHLCVDIKMHITGPADLTRHIIVPHALQRSRKRRILTGRRQQQITAILEHQLRQAAIICAAANRIPQLLAGFFHLRIFAGYPQVQRNAVHISTDILTMTRFQLWIIRCIH